MFKKSKKDLALELIALISTIGVLIWLATNFFGGMILWAFTFPVILLIIILLYCFSLVETANSIINKGRNTSNIKIVSHFSVLLTIIFLTIYNSELLKSEKLMSAVLKDDLYQYKLIFRENGNVENLATGIFGYSQTFNGKYRIDKNLIIFSTKPYDNDFIPDSLLIDKHQKAIFMNKDEDGNFITKKEWLNHFEVIENE